MRQSQQHICADMRRKIPTQNNMGETSEDAAQETRTQQRSREKATLGQTEMEAIEETRSSEPRKTNKN